VDGRSRRDENKKLLLLTDHVWFHLDSEGIPRRGRLCGELTIYNAAALKSAFDSALEVPDKLEINLAGVTEIDTAGVQLLMMLKRDRATVGRSLALTNHSNEVLEVFDMLGLIGYFSDPVILTEHRETKEC